MRSQLKRSGNARKVHESTGPSRREISKSLKRSHLKVSQDHKFHGGPFEKGSNQKHRASRDLGDFRDSRDPPTWTKQEEPDHFREIPESLSVERALFFFAFFVHETLEKNCKASSSVGSQASGRYCELLSMAIAQCLLVQINVGTLAAEFITARFSFMGGIYD